MTSAEASAKWPVAMATALASGDHQGQQGHVIGFESATGRQAEDWPHEPVVVADEQRPQEPMTSAGGPRRWQLDLASRDEEEVDRERDREESDETKEIG